MLDMRVEISKGHWLRVMWSSETESAQMRWETGKPPATFTPAMKDRLRDAVDELVNFAKMESLKAYLEDKCDD
jgi:hypothetical protein